MKKFSILLSMTAILSFGSCQAALADHAADEAAIRESSKEWIARFKEGDIDGLMKLYMPGARVALHGQKMMTGLPAIRAFFAPQLAARPDVQFLLDIETIKADGQYAFLISKYWYVSHGGGLPAIEDAGRSILEYQRDIDGKWKILVDMDQATPDAAFPPPPTAQ